MSKIRCYKGKSKISTFITPPRWTVVEAGPVGTLLPALVPASVAFDLLPFPRISSAKFWKRLFFRPGHVMSDHFAREATVIVKVLTLLDYFVERDSFSSARHILSRVQFCRLQVKSLTSKSQFRAHKTIKTRSVKCGRKYDVTRRAGLGEARNRVLRILEVFNARATHIADLLPHSLPSVIGLSDLLQ